MSVIAVTLLIACTVVLVEDTPSSADAEVSNYSELDAALSNAALSKGTTQITITKTITVNGDFTITASESSPVKITRGCTGYMFEVTGGTFTVGSNVTIDGGGSSSNLSIVHVNNSSATFVLEGGTLKNNEVISNPNSRGGAVFVEKGSFTMDSGTICNNSAYYGGGIRAHSNTEVTIKGGEILDNSAINGGGAIILGKFTMTGGTISGNETAGTGSEGKGAGLYLFNNTSNYTLEAFISGGSICGNTGRYGGGLYLSKSAGGGDVQLTITNENGSVEITGNVAVSGSAIYCDVGEITYSNTNNDNNVTVTVTGTAYYKDTRTTLSTKVALSGYAPVDVSPAWDKDVAYNSLESAIAALNEAALNDWTFGIMSTITIDSFTGSYFEGLIPNEKNVTFVRDGDFTGCMFKIPVGSVVKMTGSNITLNGSAAIDRTSQIISVDGNLTLEGIHVINNRSNGDGGAIIVNENGILTIESGEFTNNNAYGNGGAICVGKNGELTINGGTFSGNKAVKISQNGGNGGAIRLNDNCTFEMSGDTTITNNTAENNGGAISIRDSTATITGGTITGNFDENKEVNGDSGKGIHIFNSKGNSSLTISGTVVLDQLYAVYDNVRSGDTVTSDIKGGSVEEIVIFVQVNSNKFPIVKVYDTFDSSTKIRMYDVSAVLKSVDLHVYGDRNSQNGYVELVYTNYYSVHDGYKESYTSVSDITSGKSLSVMWRDFAITYNLNGGNIADATYAESYMYEHEAILPTDVRKSGNTFGGWYDNEELSGSPITSISGSDIGDKTYWAKWTEVTYPDVTVSYYSGTYDGKAHNAATLSGTVAGDEIYYSWTGNVNDWTDQVPQVTDVSTATLYVKVVRANYADLVTSGSLSVGKASQAALVIDCSSAQLSFGSTFALGVSGGTTGNAVVWSVTVGVSFATVDSATGEVVIIGVGDFTVTALMSGNTSYKDVSASVSFSSVNADQPALSIVGGDDSPAIGNVFTLSVVGGAFGSSVTWSMASGSQFATITPAGTVTVIGVGSFTVRAVSTMSGYNDIQVDWAASSVKLDQSEIIISGVPDSVVIGDSFRLSASGGSVGGSVQWSIIQGSDYALIGSDGTVTTIGVGSFTVSAYLPGNDIYGDAVSSIIISVSKESYVAPVAPAVESIGLDSVTLVPTEGYEYSMDGSDWQSENVFSGLEMGTEYSFYQRVAEDDDKLASAASEPTTVTTRGEYYITVETDGNGTSDPAGTVAVEYGASITVTAMPSEGYVIDSISVDGTVYDSESVTFTPESDLTVYISFVMYHTITATSVAECLVSPQGATLVRDGGSITYSFTPDAMYEVSEILIDGVSVAGADSYTFENVTADHTISVVAIKAYFIVSVSSGNGGSFDQEGEIMVRMGSSQTFTAVPDEGNTVTSIIADGSSVSGSSITFTDISGDHKLHVTFGNGDTKILSVVKTDAQDASIFIDDVELDGGFMSVNSGETSLISIVPDRDYLIESITVNGVVIDLMDEERETGTTLELAADTDLDVQVKVSSCYHQRVVVASDGVVVSGDAIRYNGSFTANRLTPDSVNWGMVVDNGSAIAYYIEAFTNTADNYAFHGDITVTIFVGTEYNGNYVPVMHKSSVTGLVETFTELVVDGYVTVTVSDLSPFMVQYPDVENILPYIFVIMIVLTFIILLIAALYRSRVSHEARFGYV